MTNSRSPTKIERVERVEPAAALDLVGADRERGDRAGHRLAGLERVRDGAARRPCRRPRSPRPSSRRSRGRSRGSATATMPETAAGNTTCVVTVRRRAPMPYAASRSDAGNGVHRVLGDRCHERDREDPDADPGRHDREGARRREQRLHDGRVDHLQGEVARGRRSGCRRGSPGSASGAGGSSGPRTRTGTSPRRDRAAPRSPSRSARPRSCR